MSNEPAAPEGESHDEVLPHVDFGTFIMSLATNALVHLGEVAHPEDERLAANLSLAKQAIDMIGMLQEKTRGNLTKEEDALLEHVLIDLRLKYVAKKKQ